MDGNEAQAGIQQDDDLGFRPAAPKPRSQPGVSSADDLGFRPAASSRDDLGFRPAEPAVPKTPPIKPFDTSAGGMPTRTAISPGIAPDLEQPYHGVPGVFGQPMLTEESKQRLAANQINRGQLTAGKPGGVGGWLEDLESDIRHGTGVTAPGRGLRAMGAPGTESGVSPITGETIAGPIIGPIRVARGLKQALGPYAGEPADVSSELHGVNEAVRGGFQTLALPLAATNPAFIPTIAPYAVGGSLAETGLLKIGVPSEAAELASNIALIGGGMLHGMGEARPKFEGATFDRARAATEPVIQGETVPDYLKGVTDKTAAAVENARRLERINAPVEMPKLPETTAPPPILARNMPRSPMDELSAQAREARAPQEFRQQLTQEISDQIISRLRDEGLLEPPKTNVVDRRAVRPEDVEPYQRQRTFIGGENIPASVVPHGRALDDMLAAERPERLPARTPEEIELGFRPAETQRALPPASPQAIDRMRGEEERYNDAFEKARAYGQPQQQPAIEAAKPTDITADSRRVANLAIGRIRNPIENQYARDVWQSMIGQARVPVPPTGMTRTRADQLRNGLADISQGNIAGRVPDPSTRYAPDVLEEAQAMMAHTHEFLSQQQQPGRYFADMGEETSLTGRGPKIPVTGVQSLRTQFPWFATLKESPSDLARALQRREGPGYNRLVSSAADHIMRTREESRAASLSVEPNLAQLAEQVRAIDPDLAQFLSDAAEGKISQWTETKRDQLAKISEGIANARAAIEFSRAVDAVAQEERAGNVTEPPEGRAEIGPLGGPAGQGIAPPEAPELTARQAFQPPTEPARIGAPVTEPHRIGEGILPGLEGAVAEQRRAVGIEQGRRLGEEAARPLGNIEGPAGTMERESPLFRGTGASPQNEMFGQPPATAESWWDGLEKADRADRLAGYGFKNSGVLSGEKFAELPNSIQKHLEQSRPKPISRIFTEHFRSEPEPDPERVALLARVRELEQAAARGEQAVPQTRASNADTLRRAAESLTAQIEAKKNPAISNQNPTARRARIAENMYREAESIEKVQRTLHGMADASDAGELPESLTNVRSRALVEDLLQRDNPPRARLRAGDIRDLIEKTRTHPGMAAARGILSRTLGRGEFPELHGSEEIGAAEKLMDVAEERGLRTNYMRQELQDYKRAAAAGIENPGQWADARKAVLSYAGQEKPRGAERQIKDAERELLGTKIPGYFPTPKTLAGRLVDMAEIKPGEKVLEPSAGSGSLADVIREKSPEAKLDTVENQDRLRKILELKGHNVAGRDFLEHSGQYDKIVMNPPFEGGQDIEHVRHAYDLLKPGGKLVSVMSEGPFFRNDARATGFRDWLDSVGGESEKLPEASFTGKEAQRQTGTAARVVTIEKPLESERASRRGEAGFITPDLLGGLITGRLPKEAWKRLVAEPFIEKGLGIGDKYAKVRDADPDIANGLHLLDNAPAYLRAKAAQNVHDIIGDLSRDQERLFTLMADADSRENLRTNHPDEYKRATNDPAIQEALTKYRPIEQQLTATRERLGGATLDRDYLRRVYDQHIAGINQAEALGTSERATTAFDRVIQPQRLGNMSREATAEYHYEHGLHEFGPAFGTKFLGTSLRALEDRVARDFISKATEVRPGEAEPRSITYRGEKYYRPDLAREMRDAGQKDAQAYDRYDPNAGVKYPQQSASKFLGPQEIVRTLNDYGARRDTPAGPLRRFFQEQILGFGFGIPHVANILRRVTQSVPLGAANPEGWARAWQVAFGKELRERGIKGIDDPTFDRLMQQGAITTGEMANLKSYLGGNLNPANWARTLAGVGHKLIFEPGSFGGLGGVDQRARLYVADLVKSQRPGISDSELARAVNTQLGDYNRANWSDRQKFLGKFMMFPGWDASSMRWVIQHPIKTTVPPALLIWTANQILNRYGQNRPEDASDIQNIHFGDRSIGLTILRESMARNLMRPAFNYAQSSIRGETGQRRIGEAVRGITQGAGGLVGMMRPDITLALDVAMNRQSPFGGKELIGKGDWNQEGKVLPNLALEKLAAITVRHALPQLDRLFDSNEEIDLRSFAGGNLGMPNYKQGAEQRLKRNVAETMEVSQTLSRLAKTDHAMARKFIQDPDNAAYALFRNEFARMSTTLKRIDDAKEAVNSAKNLSANEKRDRLATIEHARENLLRNADGLDSLLFKRKQENRERTRLNTDATSAPPKIGAPPFMPGKIGAGSVPGAPAPQAPSAGQAR
jgi:hypothetical protein